MIFKAVELTNDSQSRSDVKSVLLPPTPTERNKLRAKMDASESSVPKDVEARAGAVNLSKAVESEICRMADVDCALHVMDEPGNSAYDQALKPKKFYSREHFSQKTARENK